MREICFLPDARCRMNRLIFTPDEMRPGLPLLCYLHGAGERGTKTDHLYRHGVAKLLHEGRLTCEAVVLIPQCPAHLVWNNVVEEVKAMIDQTIAEYGCDRERITLTGSSMGGYGTWEMGVTYGNFFAGVAPVAGGGMSWRCANLRTTPVWAFCGTEDTAVPPVYSQLMVDAVNAAGGSARMTLLPGKGHNDGIAEAYEETDLIPWLLRQRRTDFTRVPDPYEEMF